MSELVLQATNIKKQFGVRTILDFESFQVYEGNKIGVVGDNGAGKTTLLSILSGDLPPDEGRVDCTKNVGYIRQFEENLPNFSGGENVKKRIQRELSVEDSIVFADEPTANLDKDGVIWVRNKLLQAQTVLLISHDRQLLDDICDRIVEVKDGGLQFYTGNYADYLEKVKLTKQQLELRHQEYLQKKAQLEAAVQVKERKAAKQRRQKKTDLARNASEARLGGHKRAASQKKMEHEAKIFKARLEKLEDVEMPRKEAKFRMNFSLTDPPRNKNALSCQGLSFSYGSKEIFREASFTVPTGRKVAVTGKNGAGKTTLLRLIHQGHEAIAAAPKLRMGYFYQGLENLREDKTVLENALDVAVQDRASVYSILAGLLFSGGDFEKKAGFLSGGERIRLSLAMLIASSCNGLMLDEPTNYLDIRSVEAVEKMVRDYPGTVLVVSHDERFLSAVTDMELRVGGGEVIEETAKVAPQKSPADKLVLEMRRTRLTAAISSAPPEQKVLLEQEYDQVLRDLREL